MKATECMLAFDFDSDRVKVGPWPDRTGWSDNYDATVLACFAGFHNLDFEHRKKMIYIEAWHAVLRSVDPQALHRELLKLDEYVAGLAGDPRSVIQFERSEQRTKKRKFVW